MTCLCANIFVYYSEMERQPLDMLGRPIGGLSVVAYAALVLMGVFVPIRCTDVDKWLFLHRN